ncbi:hypothetical protein [Moheibacter lacus]|uniref:Aminopeptidase N n=1 Tax=Moheibacter lacus TaxID=2745851 RepID=A0A838ZJS5_9FLAO|nr:hypothetical protein [Moheibacter lacus]MBA5629498.1 hypothetical protein [Moheibacter lacus]
MRNFYFLMWLNLICFGFSFAQQTDSIFLKVKLDTARHEMHVEQEFVLINQSPKTLNELYLHNWANAYSGKLTVLNKIKLQDRKGALHFSEREDRGGAGNLIIRNVENDSLSYQIQEREFIKISLPTFWRRGEKIRLRANYTVRIPSDAFTRYGRSENGNYLLKYFFLQPATVNEFGHWVLQHYKDFEELTAYPSYYELELEHPENYQMTSDLEWDGERWTAENMEHFRVYLTQNELEKHSFLLKESGINVDFGFSYDTIEKPIVDSLLPHQLRFLEDHLGHLPTNQLFVSYKTKKEQEYFGVDDLDAWLFEVKLFSEEEKNALKLFQILSYEYVDRLFSINKIEDHWLKNGLQFYLTMKYVDETFPDLKLVGHLPDKIKVLGIKPLNFFHAAKLKMNDRYKLLYLYLVRQNYDQAINTPLDELSNMNQIAMSGFKTGLTFYYMDQYLENGTFYELVKRFSEENRGKLVSQMDFRNYLIENSPKDLSWFFDDYIDKKDKINFKLVNSEATETDLKIMVKNQTQFSGPFQVVASKAGIPVEEEWYNSTDKITEVSFPKGEYDKIELNPGYLFPEFNDRDNYMRTRGLFKNGKKLQFKLYSDIENPEYAQIFMNPQIRWNNYDKFLIGMRFHNQSLLTRPFKWNITPKISTGTGKIAGSGGVQNTFTPQNTIFRSITIGGSAKYEHYDADLTYLKWSVYASTNFEKDPRETLSHGFMFSYDNLDKEVPKFDVQTDEDKYGLWNLTYYYSKPDYINESYGSVTFQTTEVFQKVMGEIYYRWRFAPKKQLGIRLFAGSFISNESDTDYFNFGVSKVSDYAFNINLLGRSESSGILSQQYVMAESGFKSQFDFTVNQWVVATNFELPIWKIFDVYADAGVYKNKFQTAEFIYDTGIRVKFIPDFLEFYLPVQSSLGFEPAMDKYWERIRFTFNFNLSSIINYLRRGWY